MTIFFTKNCYKKEIKTTHPSPAPRTFNKTCLQHEVLTKCCHRCGFFGPHTPTSSFPHRPPVTHSSFPRRRESIAPQGLLKHYSPHKNNPPAQILFQNLPHKFIMVFQFLWHCFKLSVWKISTNFWMIL